MEAMALAIQEIKKGNFYESQLCNIALLHQCSFIEHETKSPSGLNFLDHAFAMVKILVCLEADQDTIDAALLYSMVEYGDLPCEDLDELSPVVFNLVNGIQKMSALNQLYSVSAVDDSVAANDSLRKMMLAMVHDGRIVLIKLVEQVVILLHSKNMSQALRTKHANETMMIYAPLSNRLGLSALKWQLEDLAFKIQNPEMYKALSEGLRVNRVQREKLVTNLVSELKQILQENSVQIIECYGRAKHLYSLYKKMQRKDLTLQEIYDAVALRVIVKDLDHCYQSLSIIHDTWDVVLKEFDDYIASPKKNGYQSIHTAVIYEDSPVEIQIRTQEMHDAAEIGFAAHWLYKEGDKSDIKNKSKWLLQLTKLTAKGVDSEVPNTFEQNAIRLFQDRVFVFTPNGEIKDLVKGATALDFAYTIHSYIGHKCRGVKINGVIAPIKTVLKNGDKIEVLTSNIPSPSKDWLSAETGYLKTAKARAKVASWFRAQDDNARIIGSQKFTKFCKAHNLDHASLLKDYLDKHKTTESYFFYCVGSGDLKLENIFKFTPEPESELTPVKITERKPANDILVSGMSGIPVVLAGCCYPMPGDKITGVLTKKRGVVVHRYLCSNLSKVSEDKIVQVNWSNAVGISYEVKLNCSCYDYLLANDSLQSILISEKIRLTRLNVVSSEKNNSVILFEFSIAVKNTEQLERFIAALTAKKSIINIWR